MATKTADIVLEEFKRLAPGFYTERDGDQWYVVTPTTDRIAEGFDNRNDARKLVCWLAGSALPEDWRILAAADLDLSITVEIPGRSSAIIWTKECYRYFPGRVDELRAEALSVGLVKQGRH